MGSLSLPSSGSVYLDANSVIYSVEGVEPYRTLLEPLWLTSSPATSWLVSSHRPHGLEARRLAARPFGSLVQGRPRMAG